MTAALTAAVLGAGAQGAVHAFGLSRIPGMRIVAISDVDPDAAASLAARHDARAYTDLEALLADHRVDLLSICAPAAVHRAVVDAAIAHGVRAIHCEKPMALTYGDARHLVAATADAGVALTVNHQRRFDRMHREVRELVQDGVIGALTGAQGYCANLFDWGSHTLDLIRLHLGDPRAVSVLAQIDVAARKRVYGALTETAGIVKVRFDSGTDAIIATGRDERLHALGDNGIVLQGTRGRVDIFGGRALVHADGREPREIAESVDPAFAIELGGVDATIIEQTALALADLARCLTTGEEPVLHAHHGLAAAEIIFAAYESSVRRGTVRLPLDVFDNPLQRGLDQGLWTPAGEIVSTY
ncbi:MULTISPECIES: Gfo/Idh/MocA family oxidoreductase [unclassified Microbacterium]|uniref:Gfo/Idh/MocA family protein n=1 Tax=unclassified Microbacterium TaxID=2609290 RepID=UPI000D519675|nr:Gfo/Idh/MocA family oxidoreductase [Microbacterium sp. TPD7012]PVE98260.1 gfo/Idh/MocA family oxidoreductase [Microbacterium sp. TPD7012]